MVGDLRGSMRFDKSQPSTIRIYQVLKLSTERGKKTLTDLTVEERKCLELLFFKKKEKS